MAYMLYTDGSAVPNPGPCGCGGVLVKDNTVIWTVSEYLGEGTNNYGEFTAILRGLQRCKELGIKILEVYSDSELCVHVLTGVKVTKKEHLLAIYQRIQNLVKKAGMQITFNWIKAHANHKYNEMADRLANASLQHIHIEKAEPRIFKNNTSETTVGALIALKCPYAEKDEVKKLGAKWNVEKKSWMVTDTAENRKIFSKWLS